MHIRIVLVFIVNSLILFSVLSTSLSRPASAIGLQDNVKEQTDPTNSELQQDNADPFKSKDLNEKVNPANISSLDKHKDSKDKNPSTQVRNDQCDKDKTCSDTPKVHDEEISSDNKKTDQKVTSSNEGNGKNHFELPIDIPFP
ncbi:MAG TPA: hypothetical protein VE177_03465 [Candidatus Binatus sp.]|nr:hypothetical protein [Candidatus Binatus sp.]